MVRLDTSKLDYRIPASMKPGQFEVVLASMSGGKSKWVMDYHYRLVEQQKQTGVPIYVIKPNVDTEDGAFIKSRAYGDERKIPAQVFRASHPTDIFNFIQKDKPGFVLGDEMQMPSDEVVDPSSLSLRYVLDNLLLWGNHVIFAGLATDFRREVFGNMGYFAAVADVHHVLKPICQVPGCGEYGIGTQRLIGEAPNKHPAPYSDPVLQPGKRDYRCVCLEHHIVPGRPGFDLTDKLKKE